MALFSITRAAFTQINTVQTRAQVFGGRIQVAESATPAADDWQVWPEGAVVDIIAVKFARAVDTTTIWVQTQAL